MNDDLHLPIESFCLNLDGFSGIIPIFFDFLQFLGILKSIPFRLVWDKLLPLSWLGYHSWFGPLVARPPVGRDLCVASRRGISDVI